MKTKQWTLRTVAFLLISLMLLSGWAGLSSRSVWAEEFQDETALTIGDRNITVSEMNYLLGTLFMETVHGYAFTPEGREMYSQAVPSETGEMISFKDALLQAAERKLLMQVFLDEKSEQLTVETEEEDRLALEKFLEGIREDAQALGMSEDELFEAMYGPGANADTISPLLERELRNARVMKQVREAYEITNEDLEDELTAHAPDYELVSYRAYTFIDEALQDPELAATVSEEDLIATTEELKVKAEELRTRINDEMSFLAETFAVLTPDDQAAMGDTDFTLNINQARADLPEHFGEWLFAPERENGEITVVSAPGSASVLFFLDRGKDATPVFTARHILLMEAENEGESAMDKARAVLSEYESGTPEEKRFAALAKEYSEDLSTAPGGGLMENVIPGTLLREYEDWCLDPARNKGDTELFEIEGSGVYLVYFVSTGAESYKVKADQTLRNLRLIDEMNEALKDTTIEYMPEGMELVMSLSEE